jgi:glycosyltransferase involved in cell wall biosynthesis
MLTTKPTIGCVIPARNEAGYLKELINEILSIDKLDELIIVEGGSIDDTWRICQSLEEENKEKIKSIKQSGVGKFNAVLEGAEMCSSDLILIWDADGTVAKSDVLKVLDISSKSGNPVIGNRLTGKMEKKAMRHANKIGNWIFAILWSPLLGQKPIDLLCGTKIFPRDVYVNLPQWLQKIDPYGDFALIAYSRKLNLNITSQKVDYFARKYGSTNIARWRGGVRLTACTIAIYFWFFSSNLRRKLTIHV